MEGDPVDGDRPKDVGSEEEVQLRPQGNDECPGGGSPHEDSDGQDAHGQMPQRVRRQGHVVGASRPVAQRRQPPRLAKNKGKKSTQKSNRQKQETKQLLHFSCFAVTNIKMGSCSCARSLSFTYQGFVRVNC